MGVTSHVILWTILDYINKQKYKKGQLLNKCKIDSQSYLKSSYSRRLLFYICK